METDKPPGTDGTTEGLSTGEIIGIALAVLTLLLGGGLIWRLPKLIKFIRSCHQNPNQEDTSGKRYSLVSINLESETNGDADLNETSGDTAESVSNMTELDKMSGLSAGRGNEHADEAERSPEDMDTINAPIPTSGNATPPQQTFYDIYLVSSLKQTPDVQKMKRIIESNGWTYTTPFNRKLGEPEMQDAAEAVETCSHVVVVITHEDCSKKNGKYNMIIEMAFECTENGDLGGKIIPIRCCDKKFLPLLLRSLTGSTVDDDDLEERMKITIDKTIRKQREAQSRVVSGASGVTNSCDNVPSACSGASDVTDRGDNVSSACSEQTRNTVLTDKYFMDLAKEIGAEWEQLGLELYFKKAEIECIIEEKRKVVYRTLYIFQTWMQRTLIKEDREKVDVLCKALTKCDRVDLSEKVRLDSGFDS